MTKYVFLAIALACATACSKSDNHDASPATPSTPSRVGEHNAAECPVGMAGTYIQEDDSANGFVISQQGGTLILSSPKSGDITINGTPTIDKQNGSSNTAICKGGAIEWRAANKDGSSNSLTLVKTVDGLKVEGRRTDGHAFETKFRRTGIASAPTVPMTRLTMAARARPVRPKSHNSVTKRLFMKVVEG